jgi:hypothetical protein
MSARRFRSPWMLVVMMVLLRLMLQRRRQRTMPVFLTLFQRLMVRIGSRSRVSHYVGRLLLILLIAQLSQFAIQTCVALSCLLLLCVRFKIERESREPRIWRIGTKGLLMRKSLLSGIWQQRKCAESGGAEARTKPFAYI